MSEATWTDEDLPEHLQLRRYEATLNITGPAHELAEAFKLATRAGLEAQILGGSTSHELRITVLGRTGRITDDMDRLTEFARKIEGQPF